MQYLKDEREYEAKAIERQEEQQRKEQELQKAAIQNVVSEASGQVRSSSSLFSLRSRPRQPPIDSVWCAFAKPKFQTSGLLLCRLRRHTKLSICFLWPVEGTLLWKTWKRLPQAGSCIKSAKESSALRAKGTRL